MWVLCFKRIRNLSSAGKLFSKFTVFRLNELRRRPQMTATNWLYKLLRVKAIMSEGRCLVYFNSTIPGLIQLQSDQFSRPSLKPRIRGHYLRGHYLLLGLILFFLHTVTKNNFKRYVNADCQSRRHARWPLHYHNRGPGQFCCKYDKNLVKTW